MFGNYETYVELLHTIEQNLRTVNGQIVILWSYCHEAAENRERVMTDVVAAGWVVPVEDNVSEKVAKYRVEIPAGASLLNDAQRKELDEVLEARKQDARSRVRQKP